MSADRTRYRAAWVLPIDQRPIRDGWVEVRNDVVVGVGATADRQPGGARPGEEVDLGTAIVMPGLVNAHTHLELSGLRDQVPPAASMPAWAEQVMTIAATTPPDILSIGAAIEEARRSGTVLVGDISNTLASVRPLRDAGMCAVVFRELLGFDERAPRDRVRAIGRECRDASGPDLRVRLAAHAPYSVSRALFTALRETAEERQLWPLSVHAAESPEELEFLRAATGAWRGVLERRGRWDPRWQPSTGSVAAYLDDLGWLGKNTLLVHGVQLTESDLAAAAASGATVVTCPRSNQWTGAGVPPVERFYRSGVRVAVGTDSLASVEDLNVFAELREVRRCAPSIPGADILRSATASGAEALGYGTELGRIAPGVRARLIQVRCAGQVDDVEEYLLSGIHPEQVAWLDGPQT